MPERPYNSGYIANLPVSGMIYPDNLLDQFKYYVFKIYNPIHPYITNFLLTIGAIHHEGRQKYLLGKLREDKTIDDLLSYLVSQGFKNHFIAWIDDGQVASLRLADSFKRQYHLRIFKDGELRGHYEYTPECHPIAHLNETDIESRREEFMKALSGWIDEEVEIETR